jgi:hypothetical protein
MRAFNSNRVIEEGDVLSIYKPETVASFKEMYAERKSTVEYMIKFGNTYDKALATLIKNAATGASA